MPNTNTSPDNVPAAAARPPIPPSVQRRINEEATLKRRGFTLGHVLGEGSYATVCTSFYDKINAKCAMKIICRRKAPKDFLQKFLPRELRIIRRVRHKNIISFYDVFEVNNKVYIAMEIAGHGDLLEYIKLRGALPEEKSRNFFTQLIDGVEYMHRLGIVHRDLKCENLLLDGKNNIKISDFGFSREFNQGDLSKTFCGSAAYAAPEVLQGIPYQPKAYDVWSMGVILYIMICGSMPYDDSNIKRMIKDQTEKKLGFSSKLKLSKESKELVLCILRSDVSRRYSILDIRQHTWMSPVTVQVPSIASTSGAVNCPPSSTLGHAMPTTSAQCGTADPPFSTAAYGGANIGLDSTTSESVSRPESLAENSNAQPN
ncbi:testis-specific serine/threonine-protein kinase 1-like [Anneissia japonica]|uniref:testis-specific serine/threonine-protein kinase 1-like n=1 Tax=Anneissia japonica TaxID=1529436 RepID=UPI001425657A|nr:testis-specific serine/threonine-protein kinase 1-like [Anneissia japonica]